VGAHIDPPIVNEAWALHLPNVRDFLEWMRDTGKIDGDPFAFALRVLGCPALYTAHYRAFRADVTQRSKPR
jgi:Arc/MetJ family transcription regulator